MWNMNKRNTAKEKAKENKGYPYHKLRNIGKPGVKRYRIVDDDGKSYGSFRIKVNAQKTIEKLKKDLIRDDFMIEHLQ